MKIRLISVLIMVGLLFSLCGGLLRRLEYAGYKVCYQQNGSYKIPDSQGDNMHFGKLLAVFTAILLFAWIDSCIYPITVYDDIQNFESYRPFGYLVGRHPLFHLIWIITVFSAYTSVWSVAGLAVSAFIGRFAEHIEEGL